MRTCLCKSHISQTSHALINSEGERSHLAQSLLLITISQSHRASSSKIHLSFAPGSPPPSFIKLHTCAGFRRASNVLDVFIRRPAFKCEKRAPEIRTRHWDAELR